MAVPPSRTLVLAMCFAACMPSVAAQHASAPGIGLRPCRQLVLEGEVGAGHPFSAPLGNGLVFLLQPIASGWIIRVEAAGQPPLDPDYAELATPPYRSVTPLSVSTDFSFRAQDAVGWNPRRFRIAPDRAAYRRLLDAYRQLPATGTDLPIAASQVLAHESARGIAAEFEILDARLVPGTANQWQAAAAVASHFSSTAHTIDTKDVSGFGPLGSIRWMRFRVRVDLPPGFAPAPGLPVTAAPCLAPA